MTTSTAAHDVHLQALTRELPPVAAGGQLWAAWEATGQAWAACTCGLRVDGPIERVKDRVREHVASAGVTVPWASGGVA